jgi:uncharacterized protein YjbJ (UPF0337 family)
MTEATPGGQDTGSAMAEKIKGKAKRLAGALTGDDGLKVEGRLHEQKADTIKESRELSTEALQSKAESKLTAREREILVERQRLRAEVAAERQEATIEQQEQAERARIEREHAQQEAAVERAEQVQEVALDKAEFSAARERAAAERDAIEIERSAERARANASALDHATEEN